MSTKEKIAELERDVEIARIVLHKMDTAKSVVEAAKEVHKALGRLSQAQREAFDEFLERQASQ